MLGLTSKGSIKGTLTSSEEGGTSSYDVDEGYTFNVADGTLAGQANAVYIDDFDIAPSGTLAIDLSGSLVDVLGDAVVFTAIKEIYLEADAANVNNVVIGAGTFPFVGGNNAGANTFAVKPGGIYHVCDGYSAGGWAVGAGASDGIQLANSGGGTNVTGRIILVGER
jgi:hypothetical protein